MQTAQTRQLHQSRGLWGSFMQGMSPEDGDTVQLAMVRSDARCRRSGLARAWQLDETFLHSPASPNHDAHRSSRQALFDYTATEADELTLARGETMVICGSPEEGWYECELRGRVGMVPANYVRLMTPDLRWVCEIHDA